MAIDEKQLKYKHTKILDVILHEVKKSPGIFEKQGPEKTYYAVSLYEPKEGNYVESWNFKTKTEASKFYDKKVLQMTALAK